MKKLLVMVGAASGLVASVQAMEQTQDVGTAASLYKKKILSHKNIAQFAQMPPELAQVVDKWANEHKDLLQSLIPTTEEAPLTKDNILAHIQHGIKLLCTASLALILKRKKLGPGKEIEYVGNTYVFKLPVSVSGKDYCVKIPTPTHRVYNLEAYNGIGWGQGLKEDSKITKTLQSVSRAWHALQTKQAIEKYTATDIHVPATYLAQVPGRTSIADGAYDENSFIIQEELGLDWVALRENKELIEKLSEKTIKQLYLVMKQGVWWAIHDYGLVNKKTYQICQSSFQQPNNQNPELFGYTYSVGKKLHAWNEDGKASAKFKLGHDKGCAILGFAQLLKEAHAEKVDVKKQSKLFQSLVEQDPEIGELEQKHQVLTRCKESLKFAN